MMGLNAVYLHGINSGFGMMGRTGGMFMFMILFVILAVFGIIWLVKSSNQKTTGSLHQSDRAIEILNERYAMGEISDEEYAKKKFELKKSGH